MNLNFPHIYHQLREPYFNVSVNLIFHNIT